MAIHPIDLQTMFSNMEHVSRNVASQQISSDMSKQFAQSNALQQSIQKVNQVKATAESEAKTTTVNKDGKNSSNLQSKNNSDKKNDDNNQEKDEPKKVIEFRESYLGQHIDIQG